MQHIAAAIGVNPCEVVRYRNAFEAAAVWYRVDCQSPQRVPPSTIKCQARLIAGAAKKLLRHLEIYDCRNAPDGPGNFALLDTLAAAEGGTEDDVIRTTERVGRLAEIFDGIDAARLLERLAGNAAEDTSQHSGLMPKGHLGDTAENAWIAAMMSLYERITGRKARTSVIAPGRPGKGKSAGPLIRFLEAAGSPLGIEHPKEPESWRGRVRDNLTGGRRRK